MKRIKLFNLVAMLLMSGAWHSHANAQDALPVTAGAPQVTQNFDGMWDDAAQAATLDMPQGWRIERQMGAPRTVGSYSSASTASSLLRARWDAMTRPMTRRCTAAA